MKKNKSEKGQALILTAFGIIALVGFTALAIDGGRSFDEKRHSQNAADTAALAAALAYHNNENIVDAAQTRAASNGYDNNGTSNDVTVTVTDIAAGSGICPGNAAGKEITVVIDTTIDTTFTRVLGRQTMHNSVTAVTHSCNHILVDPFNGAAVAGMNPNTSSCAFDSGQSNAAHWTLKNGGIFSNGCAYSKNGNSVTLDSDQCVETVGTASNFTCMQQYQTTKVIPWPSGVISMMPENPCDGTPGDVGLTPTPNQTTFTDGVYCISDLDSLDKKDIVLNNATLYVTDMVFDLRFAGSGGFNGTATATGPYAGYYLIVAYNPTPCPVFNAKNVQTMVLRGNSGGTFSGTILAPSACIDVRGNGEPSGINTQIIGYNVTSNGNGEVYINYTPNPDLFLPFDDSLSLVK